MKQASALFRLLGDDARLRLLRVLALDRFNVTELTGVLGLAQSGVSRHLGLLKDAGLVAEERDGAYSYYRLAPSLRETPDGPLWPLLEAQFASERDAAAIRADDARLQEVLRLRRENFDAHAGPDTRDSRQLVPGRSWAAWARALGHLLPPVDVVDIGCGEGYLTVEVARWARRVVAVDRSAAVLERAKALAGRRRAGNIAFKRGELDRLPLEDGADGRRAALPGAPPRPGPGGGDGRGRTRRAAGREDSGARPARATRRRGCGRSWATATSGSPTRSWRGC